MSQLEQQMRHRDKEMVPGILVKAMFALMFASTAIVAYAQFTNRPQVGVPELAPIAQSLEVSIIENGQGVYVVSDTNGAVLATSADPKQGFLGVIGRVVDRERLVHRVTSDAPVTVVRRENGVIAILDPTTEMNVELIGYGADNIASFAALLD